MPRHMPTFSKNQKPGSRRVSLFRNGRNQALRIPRDLELTGREALLTREGDRLIIEPLEDAPSLLALLSTLEPLAESFPDVDESLGKLDEVKL